MTAMILTYSHPHTTYDPTQPVDGMAGIGGIEEALFPIPTYDEIVVPIDTDITISGIPEGSNVGADGVFTFNSSTLSSLVIEHPDYDDIHIAIREVYE